MQVAQLVILAQGYYIPKFTTVTLPHGVFLFNGGGDVRSEKKRVNTKVNEGKSF